MAAIPPSASNSNPFGETNSEDEGFLDAAIDAYSPDFTPYESSAPRALVYLGDTYYLTPVGFEVDFSSYGAVDEAKITFSLSDKPDFSGIYKGDEAPIPIRIYAGFPANPNNYSVSDLTPRFIGLVDSFETDGLKDELIVHCRSLAAYFIANKHTTNFNNQTSLYVINYFCQLAGLTPHIGLRSGQTACTLSQALGAEFVASVRNMREWDILLACAKYDAVDLWVHGTDLYYVAPEQIYHPTMGLHYGQNLIDCKVSHNPFYSSKIKVEVRSWNPRTRTSTRSSYSDGGSTTTTTSVQYQNLGGQSNSSTTVSSNSNGGSSVTTSSSAGGAASDTTSSNAPGAGKEPYIFYIPYVISSKIADIAQAIWKQMSLMEYILNFTIPITPGNLEYIDVTALFVLNDYVWPTYNQTYRPRKITETFDQTSGWKAAVEAVNHDLPASEI